MFSIFLRIWVILSRRERGYFILLLAMMAFGAFLEVAGIGMLVPVVAMVQDAEPFLKNPAIARIYEISGARDPRTFLIAACSVILGVFLVKNFYQIFSIWAQNRFLYDRLLRISRQMFQLYLERPYAVHNRYNSAQLIRNIQIIPQAIGNTLMPFMYLATDAMIILAVAALLFWKDPLTCFSALIGLGGVAGATYLVIRRRLATLGGQLTQGLTGMLQQVQQALGSSKETRVLCREDFFHDQFVHHFIPYNEASRKNSFFSQIPRYINETSAVTFVLILLMLAISTDRGPEAFLTLGLFTVAAIRLLPSLSRIGGALASIRFYTPSLNDIYQDLLLSKDLSGTIQKCSHTKRRQLQHELRFENVCFFYEDAKGPALENVSFMIRPNESVAFVGSSGAGKTTAVDLLLGLYQPTSGRITVDGVDIYRDLKSWKKNIGYVPQQIYLSDASILENVAFGIENEFIYEEAVCRALRMAQLESFIATLPQGLNTQVGERGVRLSGGQRQRIGIARALYHDPDVLVLDEATAALDNETESAFMESIQTLSGKKTLILIAHRLTTVEKCDNIFFLDRGKIVAEGKFESLVKDNLDFARLARRTSQT